MGNQWQQVRLLLPAFISLEMICQVKQGWKIWNLNYDNEQNISKMIGQVKQGKKLGKLNLFSVKGAEKSSP